MKQPRAFTLIELLVVIAIIAILLAILMPSLTRVREQARNTACRSNLRQYAMAARMYSDDNNFNFPYSFTWLYNNKDKSGTNCNWHDASKNLNQHPDDAGVLWPYLKGLSVHLCPTFNVVARMRGCYLCKGSIAMNPQYGYSMNSYLNGDAAKYIPTQYQDLVKNVRKDTQVKRPGATFYFSEENTWLIPGISNAGINDNNLRALPNGSADSFGTFHKAPASDLNKGTVNAVFVDSHVDTVSPYPAGNTFIMSWPAATAAPTF